MDIEHFGQLVGGEVVEKSGAGDDSFHGKARTAVVVGSVESFREEPEAVEGAAGEEAFVGGQKTAIGVVSIPFLLWIEGFPGLGDAADGED